MKSEHKPLSDPPSASENRGEGVVLVKGGCFEMGSIDGGWDEKAHKVRLDDFYLDKYEVTQGAYAKVMGENPSYFSNLANCPMCPIENVGWHEAHAYCQKAGGRLPTEAEWEYAADGVGKDEAYAGTRDDGQLGEYAWYGKNSGGKTHSVGQKKPNGLGLYDMSGNVKEWTESWYDSKKERRALRGGDWLTDVFGMRVANRSHAVPGARSNRIGFRCAGNP